MNEPIDTEINGWTPVFDDVIKDVGITGALVFGVIFRYCKRRNGLCYASQKTLSEHVGLSRQTINEHISNLIDKGYLVEITNHSTKTITLKNSGKIEMVSRVSACVGQTDTTCVNQADTYLCQPGRHKDTIKDTIKDIKATPRNSALFDIAESLSEVTGINLKRNQRNIYSLARKLDSEGATPEEVKRQFGAPDGLWYLYDWRGRDKYQKPTLKQIQELYGTIKPPEEKKREYAEEY